MNSGPAGQPDYVAHNVAQWTEMSSQYATAGERHWRQDEITWGIWNIPETELGLLPDVAGKDVLEAGCGTAYVSHWLARRGARPVGVDPTRAQLESARRFQQQFDVHFPLIEGIAEDVPYPDESFDLVISEYGASIWSDPYRWIPEAARLLRPGGDLVFLVNGTLLMLCSPDEDLVPAGESLRRPYFGMHRFEWPDDDSVEFHLGYGEWIRLLRGNGFEVLDLVELRAPEQPRDGGPYVTHQWARNWPSEQVWKARKRA